MAGVCACLIAGCGQPASPPNASSSTPTPAAANSTEGASHPSTAASPGGTAGVTPKNPWLDDGRPQSGLPRMKLYLGARTLDTELALTTQAIQKGLMWRTNIAETNAMLFVFGLPHRTEFWMKNVPMEIDVAYLDPEGTILEIHRMERQNTNPVPAKAENVQFALETAEGWFQRNGVGPGVVVRTDQGNLHETFFTK